MVPLPAAPDHHGAARASAFSSTQRSVLKWFLVTRRMPWARYDYALRPGWPLEKYGIEQQAEIVKHAFWLRNGVRVAGVADPAAYDLLVRFPGADA